MNNKKKLGKKFGSLSKLDGYRADTTSLHTKTQPPFIEGYRLSDEILWATLYCSLEEFTRTQILNRSLIKNNIQLGKFFKHYGIDANKRNLIGMEIN